MRWLATELTKKKGLLTLLTVSPIRTPIYFEIVDPPFSKSVCIHSLVAVRTRVASAGGLPCIGVDAVFDPTRVQVTAHRLHPAGESFIITHHLTIDSAIRVAVVALIMSVCPTVIDGDLVVAGSNKAVGPSSVHCKN